MKKIVFVNQSSGYLMTDIINQYCEKYDEVVLVAGSIKRNARKLNLKVKTQKIISYNRDSVVKRLFTWLIGGFQIFFLLLFRYRNHEVFYVTNPPVAYLSQLLLKYKYYLLIYDVFPDALKNTGIAESHFLYKLWSRWNKKIFPGAVQVFTIGQSMKLLLSKYVTAEKIKVIPNWSASDEFRPVPKDENPFIQKHNLQNKFVVMYSGNIGLTHCVEVLVDAANILKHDKEIVFLVIGEGKKKPELLSRADENKLDNCLFLSWQDAEMLKWSLAAADIGVVTLNEATAMLSVPSKTYNLMAVGASVLAIAPDNCELADILNTYKNGKIFISSQTQEIALFIQMCKSDREYLSIMSANSLKASANFTYKNAEQYLLIDDL